MCMSNQDVRKVTATMTTEIKINIGEIVKNAVPDIIQQDAKSMEKEPATVE